MSEFEAALGTNEISRIGMYTHVPGEISFVMKGLVAYRASDSFGEMGCSMLHQTSCLRINIRTEVAL